jgi:hypothetical protein
MTLWRQEEECEIKGHRIGVSSKRQPLPLIIMVVINKFIAKMKYQFSNVVIYIRVKLTSHWTIIKWKQINIEEQKNINVIETG